MTTHHRLIPPNGLCRALVFTVAMVAAVVVDGPPGIAAQHQALVAQAPPNDRFPAELMPLVRSLRDAGYRVLFAPPPIQGAYGATHARKKIIWLSPITVDLGIARHVLVHEAVHAAQGCPAGRLRPIGWSYPLPRTVDREMSGLLYRNYPHAKHEVEREAFMMQSHPKAFPLIAAALKQRCR